MVYFDWSWNLNQSFHKKVFIYAKTLKTGIFMFEYNIVFFTLPEECLGTDDWFG